MDSLSTQAPNLTRAVKKYIYNILKRVETQTLNSHFLMRIQVSNGVWELLGR